MLLPKKLQERYYFAVGIQVLITVIAGTWGPLVFLIDHVLGIFGDFCFLDLQILFNVWG